MSADKRRKIARLRALAASTTFPHEAASARAKADKLEAELGGPEKPSVSFPDPSDHLNDLRAYYYGAAAQQQAQTANAQQAWGHKTFTAETFDEMLRTLNEQMASRQW